jgi:hypothetical protein
MLEDVWTNIDNKVEYQPPSIKMCNIEDIVSLVVINHARLVSRLLFAGIIESLDKIVRLHQIAYLNPRKNYDYTNFLREFPLWLADWIAGYNIIFILTFPCGNSAR